MYGTLAGNGLISLESLGLLNKSQQRDGRQHFTPLFAGGAIWERASIRLQQSILYKTSRQQHSLEHNTHN
ncbi:hypothetical protein DAPPUDRAFT_248769 [Daphnia pulex]|uniref:Uncharacterized protein n=1 Tax=Daphnia pulex TaxID=6669 RepID=E9GV62_DAPPU|nr:hypothetical protein DAPPUDRAFT_248769 [Daphnia pulex]|eukprot:EFX76663.1 hypothetical protein DAPPUDRAFT_248769 [Daphnia pulex]